MKKLAIILFVTILSQFSLVSVQAVDKYNYTGDCSEAVGVGGCVNNRTCVVQFPGVRSGDDVTFSVVPSSDTNCNSGALGDVEPPLGISNFDLLAQIRSGDLNGQNIGIIIFASNLLQLFAIIAGIWAMFNFLMAGYMYISAMSDAGVTEKVKEKVTMTVIGLAIIAGSYILAGLIGLVMFGDPTFIINPKIQGVSTAAPAAP